MVQYYPSHRSTASTVDHYQQMLLEQNYVFYMAVHIKLILLLHKIRPAEMNNPSSLTTPEIQGASYASPLTIISIGERVIKGLGPYLSTTGPKGT